VSAGASRVTIGADELALVLHLPAGEGPWPCVVACHGMGASKDSDKYLLLGEELPRSGLALARFDFRGSGESSGRHDEATIATRIADLEAILDDLAKQPGLDGRVGLLGSSLGGYVALWASSRRSPPVPVVTWNTPADLREVRVDDPTGLGAALVAEVRAGRHAAAPAGVGGVLVIQGDKDEVVPPHHGRALHERCATPKALEPIPGGDHRLSEPAHRRHAVEASRRWLSRHLGGGAR